MIKKKRHFEKDLMLLSLSMFIVVASWIGFNIYHAHASSTIDAVLHTTILPINDRFDTATIEKLKSRTSIEPNYTNPLASAAAKSKAETEQLVEPTTVVADNDASIPADDSLPIVTGAAEENVELTP